MYRIRQLRADGEVGNSAQSCPGRCCFSQRALRASEQKRSRFRLGDIQYRMRQQRKFNQVSRVWAKMAKERLGAPEAFNSGSPRDSSGGFNSFNLHTSTKYERHSPSDLALPHISVIFFTPMARGTPKAAAKASQRDTPGSKQPTGKRPPSKKRAGDHADPSATPSRKTRRTTRDLTPKYCELSADEKGDEVARATKPAKSRKKANTSTKQSPRKLKQEGSAGDHTKSTPNKKSDAAASKATTAVKREEGPTDTANNAPKKKRKSKEEKEAESMPLAPRTLTCLHRIGAHVSAAGGVHNAITNAQHIGGNSLALFLKSQRKWDNPALKPEHASAFHDLCKEHALDPARHVLPHGSYLVNLASANPEMAAKAYNGFLDDLKRCQTLGITLYNFHPGNTNDSAKPDAIARLAAQLNRAHAETRGVVTVLENMAGPASSKTIGTTFQDLRDVIAAVDDKARVAVCLDTCHLFAAGYDLRSQAALRATLKDFDDVVGARYLRALHLNDSKGVFGSHRDLHQNIGLGFLGLRAFHAIMNEPRFHGIPMVLETPIDRKDERGKDVEDKGVWAREIKLLESLVGMDVEGEEFKRLERDLAARGEGERAKLQDQFDRKSGEGVKRAKGKKKVEKAAESDEE